MWSDWGTIDVTSHAVPAPRADLHAPDATASLDEPQRRPSASVVEAAAAPAAVAPDGGFHAYSYDVQRQADAGAPADSAAVHAVAAQGVAGSGGPLPFADRIGASFGAHDVSDVRAHVGGEAARPATRSARAPTPPVATSRSPARPTCTPRPTRRPTSSSSAPGSR
jgi:hypothetical protein